MTSKANPALAEGVSRHDVRVLKFGSSTLRDWQCVRRIADWLRCRAHAGKKLVAVVSALHGETDRLLVEAHRLAANPSPALLPRHLLMGEEQCASALALALAATGTRASHMSIAELRLAARGDPLSAQPIRVDGPIPDLLDRFDVLVLPGFGGWCVRQNQAVLLGRGGSDLTAIYVAHSLGLDEVTLIKDVDGIYSNDPKTNSAAQHYAEVSWPEAREIAGRLVQRQAIDAAERLSIAIEIRSLMSERRSLIRGGGTTRISGEAA